MEAVFYEHVVQYYETDRMGCVHHSNYIRWFEEARTWLMAEGGFGYDRMEALGVMSPVLKAGAEYRTMARFGETVVIETRVEQYTGTRIAFSYAVRDKATGALRCQGRTEHCFINEKGRPMVLSLSPGPAVIDKAWHLRQNANMWRITDDFWDQWDLLLEMFWRCEVWERQVSPGCWPDCDMLPIGRLRLHLKGFSEESTWTKFTKEEQVTMMSLWCIFRSPLIMGGEMRDNDAFTLSLLTNREILDMHRYGTGAHQVYRTDKAAAWRSVDTRDGGVYVALFNLSDGEKEVSACWEELELEGAYTARELWSHRDVGTVEGKLAAALPAHGAAVYKLSR